MCIHGFFRSNKCMIPVGHAFKNEGFDVYLWQYPSRRKTIEEHAENLVELLISIANERPGEPIHFVTHSLGGVIVRCAVCHPDCPHEAKIGKASLLAPPNKGAHLAHTFQRCPFVSWFFGKKAGRQLLFYEEKEMASIGEFPHTMQVLVIAGKKGSRFFQNWVKGPNDGKVLVEETRLPTPHEHHVIHVSHHWIMTSRESIALTLSFIMRE